MRVVTPRRLAEFSRKHPAVKVLLMYWYEIVKKAKWGQSSDVKRDFRTVVYIGNNRYVFDIKGNDFRLVVIIIFVSQKIYIRFIGTHDKYKKVDAKRI